MEEDIIYGILSRLPVKSLARFRCVSKSWMKYINDPYLCTIHVKEEPMPIMFQLIPRFGLNRMIQIGFLRGVQKDLVLEMCYKDKSHGYLLLGSCNGLYLVPIEQDHLHTGTYRFAVINPISKQHHDLPPISIKIDPGVLGMDGTACEAVGIGFDESTKSFKTVFYIVEDPDMNVSRVMVHTSGTSSWQKIAQTPPCMINGGGVFGHGRLHWLGRELLHHDDDDLSSPNVKEKIVVWFDVRTEVFGAMDLPNPPRGNCSTIDDDELVQLVDLNGEVGCAYTDPICIELWILKHHDEWVLHCSFHHPTLIMPEYIYYDVEISGYWNKEGDMLLTYNDGERLFIITLKTNTMREVEHWDPCVADILMYQSNLFSILKTPYIFQ